MNTPIPHDPLGSPTIDGPGRLAVTAAEVAELFGLSRSQWWKLHAAGKVPLPSYRLGAKAPRRDLAELQAWWTCGAPDRLEWLPLRDQGRASE